MRLFSFPEGRQPGRSIELLSVELLEEHRVREGSSWASKRYLGYAGRTVRMEYRLTDGPDSAWANRFLDSASTDDCGYVELFDLISAGQDFCS